MRRGWVNDHSHHTAILWQLRFAALPLLSLPALERQGFSENLDEQRKLPSGQA